MSEWGYHRRGKKLYVVLGVCIVVIIGLATFVAVLLMHNDSDAKSSNGSKTKDAAESADVIAEVAKLYILPVNEKPTVAAIKDKSKLSGQPFFDKAQDGDYLLVYDNAKLALVYRKSANKLVTVSPINPNATTESTNGQNTSQ